jgi:hypothetical protein
MMRSIALASLSLACACAAPEPQGLRRSDQGEGAEVRFDVFARPLPDIPLPNDIATRFDPASPTRRRLNASMVAPTAWERAMRGQLDSLDGWGTFAPITVGFTHRLDVEAILARHRDDYDVRNDAVYVIDVTIDSPDFCRAMPLDMGEGNFPYTLERQSYYPNDPRATTNTLLFEEVEEDANGSGVLDPEEDLDADGVLDHPNVHTSGANPAGELLAFYERETDTLIVRPLLPLRERTTYAVVLTRRLLDEGGRPVRSPFEFINHTAQTHALAPLAGCLQPMGLTLDEVAFTWSFTTQSITGDLRAVRDGLYGHGAMAWLADQYPAALSKLHPLRNSGGNVHVVPGEQFLAVARDLLPLLGGGSSDPVIQQILESHRFVAFHAMGSFESPQFFPRGDERGDVLPLHQQVWRIDPRTGEAFHRREAVTFWLTVPRREVSARPAPVVILGHGYTGSKLDVLLYGGFFARFGVAALGVECVGHGISLAGAEIDLARALFTAYGLEPAVDAALQGRAFDQNADGRVDSGADFWTAYAFHTRDVIRQSAVDYMQLIRILRSFDGTSRWEFDADGDGRKELAGDFDADGEIDVGGTASISMSGASLGGIMSTIMGGAEPSLDAVVPISGGGGLPDIGVRSIQGGVAEAVNLRMMGPLLVSLRNVDDELEVCQYVPDLNGLGPRVAELNAFCPGRLGAIDGARIFPGDTAVARNLRSGEHRCGRVLARGLFQVGVPADEGDPLRLEIYRGPLPPEPFTGCRVPDGASPSVMMDALGRDVSFQGRAWAKGSPLIALGDGFGLRRASPELRRFTAIAQIALDPADPINWAPYFEQRDLEYGTGQKVRTRALVIHTIGDMSVPVSTGAAISRAAGFVPFTERDPRWGKTPNQVLIDTGALEATERIPRYVSSAGQSVLMDVEHLALLDDGLDGYDVPRLIPPLRLVAPSPRAGGVTGTLFPFVRPEGQHGFDPPNPTATFDLGTVMANLIGRYIATAGRELELARCQVDSSCPWIPSTATVP